MGISRSSGGAVSKKQINMKKINYLEQHILIDSVDDGFNYFNGYRLEELKEDDAYYIKSFMAYITTLECKLARINKQNKNK